MKSIFQLVVCLLAIFAFNPNQVFAKDRIDIFVEESKEVLTKDFLDPDAAKFRKLEVREWVGKENKKHLALCGELNAKNAMGAYTGFKVFWSSAEGSRILEKVNDQSSPGDIAANEIWMLMHSFSCGSKTKLIRRFSK